MTNNIAIAFKYLSRWRVKLLSTNTHRQVIITTETTNCLANTLSQGRVGGYGELISSCSQVVTFPYYI